MSSAEQAVCLRVCGAGEAAWGFTVATRASSCAPVTNDGMIRFVLNRGRLPVASLALEEPVGRAGVRVLGGISVFWVALGLLSDGLVTVVLPVHLERAGERGAATLSLPPRWPRLGSRTVLMAAPPSRSSCPTASSQYRRHLNPNNDDPRTVPLCVALGCQPWQSAGRTCSITASLLAEGGRPCPSQRRQYQSRNTDRLIRLPPHRQQLLPQCIHQ
jgi:hypothetical protein